MSVSKLTSGVFRTDLKMADGRAIHYYDLGEKNRSAVDQRESETRPKVGELDRKSTRLNSSHTDISRMPSSA